MAESFLLTSSAVLLNESPKWWEMLYGNENTNVPVWKKQILFTRQLYPEAMMVEKQKHIYTYTQIHSLLLNIHSSAVSKAWKDNCFFLFVAMLIVHYFKTHVHTNARTCLYDTRLQGTTNIVLEKQYQFLCSYLANWRMLKYRSCFQKEPAWFYHFLPGKLAQKIYETNMQAKTYTEFSDKTLTHFKHKVKQNKINLLSIQLPVLQRNTQNKIQQQMCSLTDPNPFCINEDSNFATSDIKTNLISSMPPPATQVLHGKICFYSHLK